MSSHEKGIAKIIVRISKLQEPYRQNAIDWLRFCTRRQLDVLYPDLEKFLDELNPFVRNYFIRDILRVLDVAVKHFGIEEAREGFKQPERLSDDPMEIAALRLQDAENEWGRRWLFDLEHETT
ncbi:MAG: hypothetical protein GTO14_05550 [Anaerolineales bacterium]|nr:hypothetical protein [Anaerolineales bacterium]